MLKRVIPKLFKERFYLRITFPHDAKFYLFYLIIFIKKRINKIWVKEIYTPYYYFS